MDRPQTHLHSENFDLCRICLFEPESNRDIRFFHIFSPNNDGLVLSETIMEFLGLTVNKDDVKPKIICQNCYKSLLGWVEMKKQAAESQIVINYIEKKRFAVVPRISSTSGLSALPDAAYQPSSSVTNISTRSKSAISNNSKSIQNDLYSGNNSSDTNQNNLNQSSISTVGNLTNLTNQNNHNQSSISTVGNLTNLTNQNNHNQSSISTDGNLTSDSDDAFCEIVDVVPEVICISDSESVDESVQNNTKSENTNNDETTKLNYCSICKKKNNIEHDCSQYNKEFSTCLVPNCNILSRSTIDFTPHYLQHIGISADGVLCRRCFKENEKSEGDKNGHHTNCNTTNIFKCYTCHVNFNSMAEFAFHKLKTHICQLINSSGNYLCFYCEKSSPDIMNINDHMKHCLKSQTETISEKTETISEKTETISENIVKPKEETEKKVLIGKSYVKNVPNKEKTLPRTSSLLLFTCLKPSCNLLFQNFAVFKIHYREHFDIGNDLMCWQCCSPFPNLNSLRAHQVKGNCRTLGMFKCFECPEKYNDLQSLSIHKCISHDGELITNRKSKQTTKCPYCKIEIGIFNLKSHLIECQINDDKKPKLIKKAIRCAPYICDVCGKVCLTSAALSSHIKIHTNVPRKTDIKKSKHIERKMYKFTNHGENENASQSDESIEYDNNSAVDLNNLNEIDEEFNVLPSTSRSNESIISDDCNLANTRLIKETDEKLNILPDTSQSDGSITSDCGLSNISHFKEINLRSSTSSSNGTVHEMHKCVDELFSCSECPKKFSSQRGLTLHRSIHLTDKKFPITQVQNYYCTKCKEYFTCSGFSEHWKIFHGKKLHYQKSKRYSCSKCNCKFGYKIALTMHNEHLHCDITTDKNLSSSVVSLIKTIKEEPTDTADTTDNTSPSSIVLPVKTTNAISTDETPRDNFFVLPKLSVIRPLSIKECKNPVEIDRKNCYEKTNMLLRVEKAKLDNNMKLNNEVKECGIDGKDDNNTDNIHENIIQSANQLCDGRERK